MSIEENKKEQESPPKIWQFCFDYGIKGVFARIYHGSDFKEKKWFSDVESAATWLILKSKQYEEQYRQELEKWQQKKKDQK